MSWDIISWNIETKCKLGEGQDRASQMAHTLPMLMHYDNISIYHVVSIAGFTLASKSYAKFVSISVLALPTQCVIAFGVKTPLDFIESLVFEQSVLIQVLLDTLKLK